MPGAPGVRDGQGRQDGQDRQGGGGGRAGDAPGSASASASTPPAPPADRPPRPPVDPPPSGPATDPFRRSGLVPQPAPWEPPPAQPSGPVTFPPGPTPPGFRGPAPWWRTPAHPPAPTHPPTRAVPASRSSTDAPPPYRGSPPMDPPPGAPPGQDTPRDGTPPQDTPRGGPPAHDALRGGTPPQDAPHSGTPSPPPPRLPSTPPPPPSSSAPPPPPEPSASPRPAVEPSDARPPTQLDLPTLQAQEVTLVTGTERVRVEYVGSGPPTYDAEPTALPPADPEDLGDLVADTVLDGARYGACTLRAASLRGDSARYRGEPRRDALLTARFGLGEQALVLVAMATGARATPGAHRAATEACRWIGRAVGLSHARLVEDIRAARRGDLKSGLHRLTDRSLGKLRASAVEQGLDPEEYTASLRCLLLPADPRCRTRVFFGVGTGGLFRLRDGEWQDIEPRVADTAGAPVVGFGSLPHETPDGDRLTMDLGITTPPSPYEPAPAPPREPFRFRASVAREDDVLLLCTGGLAEPLRGEAPLAEHLATRWGSVEPPGLAAFLADAQVRVKGYTDDRTAAAVWEA
ncbi:protein phosphatase 2C domain-containing protein [Streptomyces sp. NBC_00487]